MEEHAFRSPEGWAVLHCAALGRLAVRVGPSPCRQGDPFISRLNQEGSLSGKAPSSPRRTKQRRVPLKVAQMRGASVLVPWDAMPAPPPPASARQHGDLTHTKISARLPICIGRCAVQMGAWAERSAADGRAGREQRAQHPNPNRQSTRRRSRCRSFRVGFPVLSGCDGRGPLVGSAAAPRPGAKRDGYFAGGTQYVSGRRSDVFCIRPTNLQQRWPEVAADMVLTNSSRRHRALSRKSG